MANTFTLISIAPTFPGSSILFSSIPQTFTDLVLKTSIRSSTSQTNAMQFTMQFNGDATSTYSSTSLKNYNGTVSSASTSGTAMDTGYMASNLFTTNTFSPVEIYIPQYTATNKNKTISFSSGAENVSTTAYDVDAGTAMWRSTAAITSLQIQALTGGTVFGSTWYLYGIKNT